MNQPNSSQSPSQINSKLASELNNLIQIISGTSELIENIWEGREGSEKYFAMLRASIERAERVTAEIVASAGGATGKVRLHPQLQKNGGVTPQKARRAGNGSLLLVDDEQMTLSLLRRILSDSGYEVTVAQSGFECLDLFRRQTLHYDVVFLDLAMPFMDGEETFERLSRILPNANIVLMAGFVETERLERMMHAGLRGFLAKPFSPEAILSLTKTLVASSRRPSGNGIAAAP